jgi:thiamine-phosphate pyrophosphorylase
MSAPERRTTARDLRVLGAAARTLNRRNGTPALPPLLLFTDPKRTPDPCAAASRLPLGSGVVYRHFGAPDRLATARALHRLCRRRRLKLLIGADWALAKRVGADGVHLPERLAGTAYQLRRAHRAWLVTAAAHGATIKHPGLDALVLAPVLPSASPSAGRALGARQANAIALRTGLPCYALGGVNADTASRLTGFAGLAGIEGLS